MRRIIWLNSFLAFVLMLSFLPPVQELSVLTDGLRPLLGQGTALTAGATTQPVSPVLECVVETGPSTYLARFGYANPNSTSVTLPIGPNNRINPAPESRGQPTTFAPGRQRFVFDVAFPGTNLVWSLYGRTATASGQSARCAAPTPTPTIPPTRTPTTAPTATGTALPTATPTVTPTPMPTQTPTVTFTATLTPTSSATSTPTSTSTSTPTSSPTPDLRVELPASVTGSGTTDPAFPASNVRDGNPLTAWQTTATAPDEGWVLLDLGVA